MSLSELRPFLVFSGPSCLGLLVLLVACIRGRSVRSIFVAAIIAVLLHLVSVFVLSFVIGFGAGWRGGSAEDLYPGRFCRIGFVVLSLPIVGRLIYEAVRRLPPTPKEPDYQGARCVACRIPIETGTKICPSCGWTQPE
jgi:hypothetical protein